MTSEKTAEDGQAIARKSVEDVSELSATSDTLGEDLETLLDEQGIQGETGSYYTPDYIIEYIVEETVGQLVDEYDDLDDISVLDPACGAGDFLLGALDYIAAERQARKPELSERAAYKRTAANNLYGVDRLPEAVAVTKHRIRRTVADTHGDAAVDGLGLDTRIKQGNSLVGSSPADLPVDVGEVVG